MDLTVGQAVTQVLFVLRFHSPPHRQWVDQADLHCCMVWREGGGGGEGPGLAPLALPVVVVPSVSSREAVRSALCSDSEATVQHLHLFVCVCVCVCVLCVCVCVCVCVPLLYLQFR